MKKIALFNHKGGVGKTSLTANIAFALARLGKRVLLVDTDPQCSLTTYLSDESAVSKWLNESESGGGRTIFSAVRPVFKKLDPPLLVEPVERRENLYLVPGDIAMFEIEEYLSDAYGDCGKRRIEGFHKVTSVSQASEFAAKKVQAEFVFFDSGPNVGPLNKSIILDCDGIIVPAACDEFSIRALSTLGHTLVRWLTEWDGLRTIRPPDAPLLRGRPSIIGYIPQRFRTWGGLPASDYSGFMSKLESRFGSEVVKRIRSVYPELVRDNVSSYRLGEVKDFGQSAVKAQRVGEPWWEIRGGGETAWPVFEGIANRLISYFHG